MNPMNYYLMLAMFMSLLWGVFVVMVGCVLHFGMGQLIEIYVQDVEEVVDLRGTINAAGVNICPIETAPQNTISLGEWALFIGSLVSSAGVCIVVYSVTGFVAAVMNSSVVMLLLLLMIVIVCCLEYYTLQLTTDIYDTFHERAQEQMVEILRAQYILTRKANMFTGTLNAIMLKTQCCGIRGPSDFRNLTFDDEEEVVYFVVSPACCKTSEFSRPVDTKYSYLKECAKSGHIWQINTLGCYAEIFNHVSETYGTLIIVGLIVLVLWQLVQVVLIILLLFGQHKVHKVSAVKTVPEIRYDKVSRKKPPKFTPYWKVSSYVSEDVKRIRSTEIW